MKNKKTKLELADSDTEFTEEKSLIQSASASNSRKQRGSGGFQSMGLSYPIYNAVRWA